MATIVDVAKLAGVAVTTVSRVMNNKGQVSQPTRDRVLAAIDELNYRPSPAARSLPRGRVHTVAVIVPFVTRPSAVERVQGVVQGLRDLDIPVSIFDVETPSHQAEHFALLANAYRPEGTVIVSLHPTDGELEGLRSAGLSPVFVDTEIDGFSCVYIDDKHGGSLATELLIDLGHERIAFIGDVEDSGFGFSASINRRLGYRNALQRAGIEPRDGYVRLGEHGRETGRRLATELLMLEERPSAIFAASDTQALGALEAARDLGLDVPTDLSIVGFDDIESAHYIGLTTIRQPLTGSGHAAADLVRRHIEEPTCEAKKVQLPLEVVSRDSTAPPGS